MGAAGRFAAFDDLVTLTVQAADGDARHGLFLPQGGYEDEAQCDINLSPSPLLKHYRADYWQCRLGTRSAPVPLPPTGGVMGARHGATAAVRERRLLSQGGVPPGIRETGETTARLPLGTFGPRAVVPWLPD